VPSRQRVRADQEAAPPVSRQESSHRREESPIGRGEQESPASSTTEDLQLVAEHGILEIQLIEAAADEQAEQATVEPVPDGPDHPGSVAAGGKLANGQVGVPIEFLYRTGSSTRRQQMPSREVEKYGCRGATTVR
jgi:hypothetical protein